MASVKETYRDLLTRYPSLYPTPLDVSCGLFCCIGTGVQWIDGELVQTLSLGDEEDKKAHPPEPPEKREGCSSGLEDMWELQYQAKLLKYNFVLENMERILNCPVDTSLFSSDMRHGHYETQPCVDYAPLFKFPDDIKPDWAKAVDTMTKWWMTNLRGVFGVGHELATERDHWPVSATEGYNALILVRNRIHCIISGEYYEVTTARERKWMDEFLAERSKKGKADGSEAGLETEADNSMLQMSMEEGCGSAPNTGRVHCGEAQEPEVHDSGSGRADTVANA